MYSDAARDLMRAKKQLEISSRDLWSALEAERPELTTKTPTRKTPRRTAMRDIRKDQRFEWRAGMIVLKKI